MIEVNFPGWQLWIFSFTVNFLVLAVQPLATLAQADTDRSTQAAKVASNSDTKDLEPKILSEINRVRTTPQDYAQWLETQRQYYDGIWLRLPGEKPVRTNRGKKALEEAIAFLKEQQPLPPLESSTQIAAAATSELKNFANSNNIQYFSYGRKTAAGIVMDLVVDELFPDRRRRQSLLSPEADGTGVVCKPDPRYAKVCAIAYSNSTDLDRSNPQDTADVAIAEPKATAPEEISQLPEPEPLPEVDVEAETEETADALVTEAEKPEEIAKTEAKEDREESPAVATLPVPPQPQAPPSSTVKETEQPNELKKADLEVEMEIAQAESEIEQEQQELADENSGEDVEIEDSEADEAAEDLELEQELESESESESDNEEASLVPEEENPVVTESTEEVAINTETAGFSEKIEQGALEEGDRIIADDGSLYDFYPLQGKEGESFTIYLESDDFDAFVALVDSNGQTIGENDDISQSDSNSQIEITLPADGVYNVIVNTYDEKGTGEYTLKVSR